MSRLGHKTCRSAVFPLKVGALGAAVAIGALGLVSWADAVPRVQAADLKPLVPSTQLKGTIKPGLKCPDPAAQRIDFVIVRRDSQFRGRVRITGIVKNIGLAPYVSGPTQQAVYLSVKGGPATPLAQRTFQNLTPGQEVSISVERDWNSSSPAEGEFPPTFVLWIGYDPDIRIDGNPQNDDCKSADDRLERSGSGVNDLLH